MDIDAQALTSAHWLYLVSILVIVVFMVMRRDVVLPSLIGLFIVGFAYSGSLVNSVQILFRGLLTAGEELFDIMLVIALMVAMLKSLQTMKADALMVAPAQKLMKTPTTSFWVLGGVMYLAAIFFWPTPATALVGTMLIPIALKSGLPPMAAAMSVNILGHGMALSGDLVIQGAPGLSESSAGLPAGSMLPYVAVLSIVTGVVAATIAFFMMRKEFKKPGEGGFSSDLISGADDDGPVEKTTRASTFAVLVPVVFLAVIVAMVTQGIRGGGATALLGGTASALLVLSGIVEHKGKALEEIVGYLREGFLFAIKIFAPVIPIAGFFFLGSGNVESILGAGAPPLLFDLGENLAQAIPLNSIALAFGNLLVGITTGLDGSGFSGLPLTASLAEALGGPAGINVKAMAAIGQMGSVWTGGGTIIAWAFGLVATAGIAGVKPLDLARKNFIPVLAGLFVATIVAIFMM